MNLPTYYNIGTVSVANGSTTVTGVGSIWGLDAIMMGDLFVDLAQPLVPPQRIASVAGNGSLELAVPWPGATITAAPYEIRYVGIIERSTAQSRRVLEQLADVKAWYDIIVADDAGRLALESPASPLRAGYRVLVKDDGVIWAKATEAYGAWIGPVEFKGDTGDQGEIGPRGVTPRGTYSGATAYVEGDAVLYNGSSWAALQASTGNAPPVLPTTSNAYWQLLARKGTDGAGTGDVVGPTGSTANRVAGFDDATGKLIKELTTAQVAAAVALPTVPTALTYLRRNAANNVWEERNRAQMARDVGGYELISIAQPLSPVSNIDFPSIDTFMSLRLFGKAVLTSAGQVLARVGNATPDASAVYNSQAVDGYGATLTTLAASGISGAPLHAGTASAGYPSGPVVNCQIQNFNIGWPTQFISDAGYRSGATRVKSQIYAEHDLPTACDILRLLAAGGAQFTMGTFLVLQGVRS